MRNNRTNNYNKIKQVAHWTAGLLMGATAVAARAQDVPAAAEVGDKQNGSTFQPATRPSATLFDSGVNEGKVELAVNKTTLLTTREKYKRFSIGQPDVADVTAVGPTSVLVTGKKSGTTQLIVWDENDKSQVVDVMVSIDLAQLKDEIKKMFPDTPIEVGVLNGAVTLKGRVPNLKVAEQAQAVAAAYTTKVMNFLEIGGGQQVVLQVQFIEMSRSASNELGFRSFFTDGGSSFGSINGPGGSPIGGLATGAGADIGSGVSLFGSGNIGGMQFELFIQAMKKNNLARTLAEPNLVATSGEDASFLAGGEVPIPVPQAGGAGGSVITIEYKEFGVRLKYNAVVLGDGRIRLKAEPEVSELDYASGTTLQGQTIPGIRTRRVSSTVELNEGQTLALAGLLQRRVDSRNESTPLLGDLPIIGAFFRNVAYTRQETELVILVTPRLSKAMNPDEVPELPAAHWRYPDEAKLYGLGDIGGPESEAVKRAEEAKAPPRYVGPNGFDEPAVESASVSTDTH